MALRVTGLWQVPVALTWRPSAAGRLSPASGKKENLKLEMKCKKEGRKEKGEGSVECRRWAEDQRSVTLVCLCADVTSVQGPC